MKAGETKDINVTFPEEYHAKDLAGKDAVFKVTLQSVKEKELPELNDEFAQEVSEFDTLEDYKKDIRKNLKEQAENRKKREKEEAVIAKIVENAEIDIPDCMIQNQIDYQLQEMEYNMSYQGITLQNYLDYTGMTMEQLREQYKEVAEQRVRTQLVLDAIREKMALEATEEEVDEELNNMAERAKKPADEFKKGINPREIEYIKERIVFDKLIDHLVNSAVEVEKAKEAKETKKEKKEEDK